MNKTEFCARVKTQHHAVLSKTEAEQVVNAVLESFTEALAVKDKISLTGFGTLRTVKRASRTGRHPRTGQSIVIPESRTVKFTPGKELRDKLNQK